MKRLAVAAAALALAGAAAARAQVPPDVPASAEYQTFEGSWSATGQRRTLDTDGDRPASIIELSGTVMITSGEGLGRGFRGQVIGFDDGHALSVGRWVWTDEKGDRIYGDLRGQPFQSGRRFVATVTGGTGRYAGLTGEYEFTWQYVLSGDGGEVQGLSVGLKGRYRRGGAGR